MSLGEKVFDAPMDSGVLPDIDAIPILTLARDRKYSADRQAMRTASFPASEGTGGQAHRYNRPAHLTSASGNAIGPSPLHEDSVANMSASTPFHESTESCRCPMCRHTLYIAYVYRNQRRASPHVMKARPSTEYALGPGGRLPALLPVEKPEGVEVCPIFAAFGFCPFSKACYLPHDKTTCYPVRIPRLPSAEDEVFRLITKAAELADNDVWSCDVCGYEWIDERCEVPLGTEQVFRQCPRCSLTCYFPYITYLVESILGTIGDDYQLFKSEVDRYRALLPDIFKIPLTYEAHRVANVLFAWSLLSPIHARDAMDVVVRLLPNIQSMISIGSGAGYIEHVFNRVMHPVALHEEWQVDHERFSKSSFDGVQCSFYGRRTIPIYAFDELALRGTYSVHVSIGGPLSAFSLNCRESVLLLCWPPFGSRENEESSMGLEALEYFMQGHGSVVIYIGDVAATGDWRFHMLLASHFKLVRDYQVRRELRRWCPQEMGFVYGGNDTIGVYERRETPLSLPYS